MCRYVVLLLVLCMLTACELFEGPPVRSSTSQNVVKTYAEEDRDWRIPATDRLRNTKLHDPTPMSIPGGKVLTTPALNALLQAENKPVLINVMQGRSIRTIPGSVWLNGAGVGGDFEDATQQKLAEKLAKITNDDKEKALVFYCLNPECWLACNAVLRSAQLGYTNLYWYRGGMHAWEAAGGPLIPTEENEW
jgi:PQQ-dependent catabolism-associated CXXCW motif protein